MCSLLHALFPHQHTYLPINDICKYRNPSFHTLPVFANITVSFCTSYKGSPVIRAMERRGRLAELIFPLLEGWAFSAETRRNEGCCKNESWFSERIFKNIPLFRSHHFVFWRMIFIFILHFEEYFWRMPTIAQEWRSSGMEDKWSFLASLCIWTLAEGGTF